MCYTVAMTGEDIKALALSRAKELGFIAAGVARAGRAAHGEAFRAWLAAGRHASMDYMARNVDKRCDLHIEWPWAKSVLCLAAGYGAADASDSPVASYARGRDYHKVLKRRCHQLADELAELCPGLQARACVDTAPILERDWAARAGLGWIGMNGCLIVPGYGSYVLLAEIILSVELPADSPMAERCGECRLCLEACPNGAIGPDRQVDARRCNSWATIENRDVLDADALDTNGSVFGCDLCQRACPFNAKVPPGAMAELVAPKPVAEADVLGILNWTGEEWDLATRGSATRRASYEMFLRNAAVAAGRVGLIEARDRLAELAGHPSPIVRGGAAWALGRLQGHCQ